MPTKLGEFLGCGVPCVCNDGIGDMTDIINSGKVGIVLNSFDKVEKEVELQFIQSAIITDLGELKYLKDGLKEIIKTL